MPVTRILTVAILAIVTTALGVITIGVAETVKWGLIGLALAALLLGIMWLRARGQSKAAAAASASKKARPKDTTRT